MNYGADGNDYFQFTTPSLAFDKASGFTTLIAFAMHVDADGTLEIGGGPVCSNGVYIGPANWGSLITTLKTPPTTVTRYEVCIGGWLDTSYDNIKSLVTAQGTGSGSILYRNFQALKNAVPGIDAINDDDEKTYDLNSTVGFANMLGGLGYKFTTAPYTFQSFWVNLNNSITNCDNIYLQCYEGGAGNDPTQWNTAFGHGVKVVPGQESNTSSAPTFRNWFLQTGAQGGFYYPDVVFSSTYWSAVIIEANGLIPSAPTGLNTALAGNKVRLSWNVVPGAISYNVKRATRSGNELTVTNISTANNAWPASNQFADNAPLTGITNYYKVSAVNTNGESLNSLEVSVTLPTVTAWFKADAISGLGNGSSVTNWTDSTGHGFTATQDNPAQGPTYIASAWNGLPVVHFNSTNSQFLTFNRPVQDDFTMFCVFRSTQGLGSGNQFDGGAGLLSGNVDGVTNDFGVSLYANGQLSAGVGNPDTSANSIAGFNDGNPHLLTFKRSESSGEVALYVDGNLFGKVIGNTNALASPLKLSIGAQPTLNNFFTGDIAEIKMYGSALSDADRVSQEVALSQKWGVTHAFAGLLAYDGFDYPAAGNLAGQNGGIGWSNSWADISGNAGEAVMSGNLPAGANASPGFDGRSTGNAAHVSNGSRAGRWLDCSSSGNFALAGYLNVSHNIGAPGKTLYLSFLQQPGSPAQFYELEFHRGDLSDPGRIAGIGNDLANAATVNLRAPASVHTPLGLGDTNVNFYIVRIDYHGSSHDDVRVYRNPTGLNEADNEPVLTMLGVADMSFNGLSMAAYLNGVTVNHDEIRLGQTWASVLGNPPVFMLQPTNQLAYVGQSVSLVALAQSSEPLSYQWYRDGQPLPGQTNAGLAFPNVQITDAGNYFMKASNALGVIVSAVATLTVQTISANISSPPTLTVGPGSNLVINATVGGASPITLQWYKDGTAIPGATDATYSSAGAGFFGAGQYVLVAGNSYGSVTSSPVNVFPNFGGLLAYEGFNYGQSSTDIGGSDGGLGWAAGWVNVAGGASQSSSNSLLAGANAPTGFDIRSVAGSLFQPNTSRKGRFLDCSPTGNFAMHGYIDGSGNIGADGTTLYISFLQQPNSVSLFYEFEFKRDDLGDGGRMAGIGNDTGDSDVHFRAQVPAGGASTFWDLGPGNTNVNFYVMRIDFKPGNDDVFIYRNPTASTEPATPTLAVSNIADMSFDGISLGAYVNNVTASYDEVRFGMTWADALGTTVSQLQWAWRTNDVSNLLLAASPNYNYQVQGATNLSGPWVTVGNVTVPSLGVSQFIESNATNIQKFYRVLNGAASSGRSSSDLVIADFESADYGSWMATGTAFGSGPSHGTLANQNPVSGYQGSGLVNSYYGSDASTGTLTSAPFVITKPYLNFLIGGGNLPGQEGLNLIITNVVVATATGNDSETLTPKQWNVSAYLGQTATLQIVDSATGGWGHILVDQITLSDEAFPSLSRTMLLTNSLLNLPVKNGSPLKRVTVTVGANAMRDFDIQLADGVPDWWAFVDVSEFTNQTATISVDSLAPGSAGLSSVVQTNGIVGATNLYQEALRPQLHFTTKRGWLNDANGMIYYGGQYHLYYQHDPFTWDGSGQKYWGHAVSLDMVHWQEVQEGIYSHSYGDDVWSGSAVVDSANTSGFKTGTNDVIVAAYYSTGRGECIAYSNDRGLTFTDYSNNPVVVHQTVGRDPHLLWYAPSNYWVMAVYDETGGQGIQFYSSPNLKQWTYHSKINGFFECPDLFQLPVDGNPNNLQWILNDASSGYLIGQFDGATFTPSTSKLPGNLGQGYYASQTFTSMPGGDNRKVRIGWAMLSMGGMPFNQAMFFPTALSLRTFTNGVRLCSQPVDEITNAVQNTYSWTNLTVPTGANPLSGIRGNMFDVRAQFTPGSAQSINFVLCGVSVTYSPSTQQITCNGDTQSLAPINGTVTLEIVTDRRMIEIFGNGGQLYMPIAGTSYNATNNLVSLTSQGTATVFQSLKVNKLKSIWSNN